ncbi:MAG: hypothetical protein OXU20_01350, partial [Myxococcales bacterium]|nr:hypothetical protein [Myxococcales bacterium]
DSANEPVGAGTDGGSSPVTTTGETEPPPEDGPDPDAGPATTPGMGPPRPPPSVPDLSDLTPEVVYTGDPSYLRVVDDQLFVVDGNTIRRMPLTGGDSEVVVPPAPANIGIIRVNSTHLFFEVNDTFWRAPLDATGATPEALYQGAPDELLEAVDDNHIYFRARDTGNIGRVSVDGGMPEFFVGSVADRLFNVVDGFAYFSRDLAGDYRVSRVSVTGGDEEELAVLPLPYWVVADGSRVHIGGRGGIYEVASGAEPVRIMHRPPSYPANGDIERMMLSGERIYWGSDAGAVGWTDMSGTTCGSIVDWGIGGFEQWTVGPDSLYITSQRDVLRLPLP